MEDRKFVNEMLKAHNEYRDRHQAPPLTLSKDLCDYAQEWAEHLIASDLFEHSDCDLNGERIGENIATMFISDQTYEYTGQEATDLWYSEVEKYTFGVDRGRSGTGHFTQVVWKGSREFGAGKASKNGTRIVVATYRPAGNMTGDFADNVLPPKDGKIVLPAKKGADQGNKEKHHEDVRNDTERERVVERRTRTEKRGGVTTKIIEETVETADGRRIKRTTEQTED